MLLHIQYHFFVHFVEVPELATITAIKLKIKDGVVNAGVDDQYLYFNSIELENEFEARYYGIGPNSDLILRVGRTLLVRADEDSYILTIMRDESVMTVKYRVAELTDIEVSRMLLLYNGVELTTYENILTYHIPDDDYIDALEEYELNIHGSSGHYSVPVHKLMTIAQLKNKLHTLYGLDHTIINLRLPKMTNELADPVTLEVYRITKDGTKIYATCDEPSNY